MELSSDKAVKNFKRNNKSINKRSDKMKIKAVNVENFYIQRLLPTGLIPRSFHVISKNIKEGYKKCPE